MTELVALSATDARALTDRIKVGVEAVWDLITTAYTNRAWDVLGYTSWDDYCTREFGTSRLRLPREERSEVVASLRESGLSIRAIAAATGDSYGTVRNELASGDQNCSPEITGTDGKTYVPKPVVRDVHPNADAAPAPASDDRFISADQLAELNISSEESANIDAMAELSDEQFEEVLSDAREAGDLSQAAVANRSADKSRADTAAQTATPKRRPITEAFDSAGFELKRAVERVVRLSGDDRLKKNKDQIKASNLSDLIRVRDAINGVITQLEG